MFVQKLSVRVQVLTKFAPLLDAQLVRAHVAPLLLHLMSRMGDSKEQVPPGGPGSCLVLR